MAWFRFKNQTRSIHKENMLPFWQPTAFSFSLLQGNLFPSFCLSFLFVFPPSLFSIECQICHLHGFKRELWLVYRHHVTGFLSDPVELPVFQQKEGPTQQRQCDRVWEAYSTADPSSTGWALHCHSQATPQESTKTSWHLGLAGGDENWILWPSLAS